MTEQCHMRYVETGKRCQAKATTQVYIKGKASNPVPWQVEVCTTHAQWYIHQETYAVRSI